MHGIDTSVDMRADAGGRDADAYSPTLREYHRLLWSKPLPDGRMFELSTAVPGRYLSHVSDAGDFRLASDTVVPSFGSYSRMRPIIEQTGVAALEEFRTLNYSIGGMMVFPANRVHGRPTINGMRGMSGRIADRMDLTLECIRRHYEGGDSPLTSTLARYPEFFALFGDFAGYVEFFLLHDLIDVRTGSVDVFPPFSDFTKSGLPADVETYLEYRHRAMEFLRARNARIDALR